MCGENSENLLKTATLLSRHSVLKKALRPYFFSHHPTCEKFDDHTINIFGKRFCIGCYVGYPTFIITFLVGSFTGLFEQIITANLWYLGLGFSSGYLLSVFGLTKNKSVKIVSKIIIGIGLSFFIGAIFSYNINLWMKIIFSILFIQVTTMILGIKRYYEQKRICNECEYNPKSIDCPGLGHINKILQYRLRCNNCMNLNSITDEKCANCGRPLTF